MQSLVQPTPGAEAAERLVVDAALAHAMLAGSLEDSSPHEWLRSYRRLHSDASVASGGRRPIDLVLSRLEEAKIRYAFRVDVCPVVGST